MTRRNSSSEVSRTSSNFTSMLNPADWSTCANASWRVQRESSVVAVQRPTEPSLATLYKVLPSCNAYNSLLLRSATLLPLRAYDYAVWYFYGRYCVLLHSSTRVPQKSPFKWKVAKEDTKSERIREEEALLWLSMAIAEFQWYSRSTLECFWGPIARNSPSVRSPIFLGTCTHIFSWCEFRRNAKATALM